MTWHLAEDSDGDETLWYGDKAVLRRFELGAKWWHGTDAEGCRDTLWSVLTRVLAPDEATVERLAMAICDDPTRHLQGCPVWAQRSQRHRDPCTCRWSNYARRVLAALAAAPDSDGEQDEGVSG